ncbi:MAG: response regulator [Chloroflexota bacterium]|nr:MAG: response regulator [Chloroflexota bacterium]
MAKPTKLNVLIVEDNSANLMLASAVLRRAGYRVSEARSAEDAIVRLAHSKPDLILMDVQLPGQDGLALTRQIKADPETADLIVVALTAHAMKEDRARALDAGCDGYIAKPINTRTLADELDGVLRARRLALGRAAL